MFHHLNWPISNLIKKSDHKHHMCISFGNFPRVGSFSVKAGEMQLDIITASSDAVFLN
jgi:hypothetical protein